MESFIGMDLGGTKLLIGEMSEAGELLREKSVPTGPLSQREAAALLARELERFLAEPCGDYRPAAVGLGLVGRVDSGRGLWYEIDRERAEPLPICRSLTEQSGLPCFADNDVRTAARAELLLGEGRRSRNFIYLNVGTGIAAGIVIGGRLLTGGHHNAGEVGHVSSGLALGVPCVCGRSDCAESLASGLGLDQRARTLRTEYPDSTLPLPAQGRVGAAEIFARSETDPVCALLTEQAASALANLIMDLVRVTDPEAVVLGGGVVADGFLLERVKKKLGAHTMRFVTNGVRLTALDGRRIGLIGACCHARQGKEQTA